MIDITLFLTFFKLGLFTFGGGYAMAALLENEIVQRKNWMQQDEFLDMIAIAESTPGPMAINMATYVGYKRGGLRGAAVASIAVCIPSVLIIYLISLFFEAFQSIALVKAAFAGIQVCVIYLIVSAGVRMLKGAIKDSFHFLILIVTLVLFLLFSFFQISVSSILFILVAGAAGIIVHALQALRRRNAPDRGIDEQGGRK